MNYKTEFYPEARFGGFTAIDGTIAFYSRVNSLLAPESVVADIGCGRGAYGEDPVMYRRQLRMLKGKVSQVIGIDVDPGAAGNPFIDEYRPVDGPRWPLEDGSIDLCLSDNVLEHVADPVAFFTEARRVLKPGGTLCLRTPNLWSYTGLVSKLVPNHLHVSVLEKAKDRVKEQDVFPTYYRCNTLPQMRRMMRRHGFNASVYGYEAEPSYLSFNKVAYFLGVLHQRYAPGLFKVGIHAFGKKEP